MIETLASIDLARVCGGLDITPAELEAACQRGEKHAKAMKMTPRASCNAEVAATILAKVKPREQLRILDTD